MYHGYDEDYDDDDGSGHDASYDSPRPRFDERAKDAKYTGWRTADQPCQGRQRQRQYNIQRQNTYTMQCNAFLMKEKMVPIALFMSHLNQFFVPKITTT